MKQSKQVKNSHAPAELSSVPTGVISNKRHWALYSLDLPAVRLRNLHGHDIIPELNKMEILNPESVYNDRYHQDDIKSESSQLGRACPTKETMAGNFRREFDSKLEQKILQRIHEFGDDFAKFDGLESDRFAVHQNRHNQHKINKPNDFDSEYERLKWYSRAIQVINLHTHKR